MGWVRMDRGLARKLPLAARNARELGMVPWLFFHVDVLGSGVSGVTEQLLTHLLCPPSIGTDCVVGFHEDHREGRFGGRLEIGLAEKLPAGNRKSLGGPLAFLSCVSLRELCFW